MPVNIVCPNKSAATWKRLVGFIGEPRSYVAFFRNNNTLPDLENSIRLLGLDAKTWRDPKGRTLYQAVQEGARLQKESGLDAIENKAVEDFLQKAADAGDNEKVTGMMEELVAEELTPEERATFSSESFIQKMDNFKAEGWSFGDYITKGILPQGLTPKEAAVFKKLIALSVKAVNDFTGIDVTQKEAPLGKRFVASQNKSGAWDVTDSRTGKIAHGGATEENARDMADIWNGDEPVERPKSAPPIPKGGVKVPLLITKQMTVDLKARGYTEAQINAMKPQEANDILNQVQQAAQPAAPQQPPIPPESPKFSTNEPNEPKGRYDDHESSIDANLVESARRAVTTKDPRYTRGDSLVAVRPNDPQLLELLKGGVDGFAQLFGKRIVFFRDNIQGESRGGIFLPSRPDVLFVNADDPHPWIRPAAHELLHAMKVQRPDLYAEVQSALKDDLAASRQRQEKQYGQYYKPEDIEEETLADLLGDQITEPAFWQRFAQKAPSTFQKVVSEMVKWMNGIMDWLNQRKYGSSRFFKDVEHARNVMADALAEYSKSQGELTGQGEPKYSTNPPDESEPDNQDDGIKTQIAGNDYKVLGKDLLQPAQKRQGDARALAFINSLKLPVEPHEENVAMLTPDGFNHDAEGSKLIEELTQAIQQQNSPGGDPAYSSALVRFINYNVSPDGGWYKIMSQDVANQLIGISSGESSWRGWMLRSVQGIQKDLLTVAANLPVFLQKTYALAFGGRAYETFFKRLVEHFRGFFTEAEIAKMLKDNPSMEADLNKLIAADQATASDRLYRAVQQKLSMAKTSPGKMEKNALFQEELNTILESLKKYGVQEPPAGEKMSALEKLRLMVTDANKDKITAAIQRAVETGEIEAGKQAARNEVSGNADAIAELDARYEAGELPTPEQIEAGLKLPNFEKWARMREEWAGYDPVTVKLARSVAERYFKGLRFQQAKVKPVDTRISITELAKQPDAEVQRVLDAYLKNIQDNIDLDGVSAETKKQVSGVIREQLLKQINDVVRPRVRDLMFEAAKHPDKLTPDEMMAQKVNAGLFADPRLVGDMINRVAGKSAIRNLLPKVSDLVKKILATPTADQAGMKAEFMRQLVGKLGVPPEQAAAAWKVMDSALTARLKLARESAMKEAVRTMTPAEIATMPPGDSKLWNRISQFFNAGGTDTGQLLSRVAALRGWNVPSPEEVEKLRGLVSKIQSLQTVSPAERARIQADTMSTDKDKAAEIERRNGERTAINTSEISQLTRRLAGEWAKFTKPLSADPRKAIPPFSWFNPTDAGRNTSKAVIEFTTANLLAKWGFPVRLLLHTQFQYLTLIATRPPAMAWELIGSNAKAGRPLDIYQNVSKAYSEAASQWIQSMGPGLRQARAQMAGRGKQQNIDRMMTGINALERAELASKEYYAKGDYSRAAMTGFIAQWKYAIRVVSALDAFQGEEVEFQELRHQFFVEMAKNGKTRAESEMAWNGNFGDMKKEWALALIDSGRTFAEDGKKAPNTELAEAADYLVKERMYQKMELMGLPSDAMRAYILRQRMSQAWQSPPAAGSLGGTVSKMMQSARQFSVKHNLPFIPTYFSQAIGNGINFHGRLTPAYKLFLGDVSKEGVGTHATNETDLDRKHNVIMAVFGSLVGSTVVLMILNHKLKVQLKYPTDKKDRDRFIEEGHKVGTVEWLHDDGTFTPFSMTVGPFSLIAPYVAGAGAAAGLADARAAQQKNADAAADAKGLARSPIPHNYVADTLAVAGAAVWNSILGGSTAAGAVSGYSEFGVPNARKTAAALASPLLPLVPMYQEVSRMMGVSMDKNMASVFDYLVPLPTSGARLVNSLGDPVRTPNDAQRIIQAITAGSYPFPVSPGESAVNQADSAAYQAMIVSGFRPPSINGAKGYDIGGTMRPMTAAELDKYTELRGQYLKANLAQLGSSATPQQAKAAYQQANAQALAAVGVQVPARVGKAAPAATAARYTPAGGRSKPRRVSLGRRTSAARLHYATPKIRISKLRRARPSSFRISHRAPKLKRPRLTLARHHAPRLRLHRPRLTF
jgi:hypothetical protein